MTPLLLAAPLALTYALDPGRGGPELLPLAIAPDGPLLTSPALAAFGCGGGDACRLEQTARADANGDFTADPAAAPEAFAETSAYYHAARARAFFEGLAGASLANAVDVVAGYRVAPLAFYLGPTDPLFAAFGERYGTRRGTIWLGRGSARDLALDGGTIYHEMAHAMLDGVLHAGGFRVEAYGASAAPEAIGEAIADTFAAAISGDPLRNAWLAGEPGLEGAVRALDNDASCPDAIDGQGHDESLVLSGALWRTRQALDPGARAGWDAALWRAIARLPARRDLSLADVKDAFAGDADLRGDAIAAELARRGAGCAPIKRAVAGASLRSSRASFVAPGTLAVGPAELAPGVLQVAVDLPPGTAHLDVSFTAIEVAPLLLAPAATPFDPVVLVGWDSPIAWRREGERLVSTAAAEARVEGDVLVRASVDVPAAARTAYVQIASRGERDGAYDGIVTGTRGPDPAAPPADVAARGSGCNAAPARPSPLAWLLAALAVTARSARPRCRSSRDR